MNSDTINQPNPDPIKKYVDAVIDRQPESAQTERAQRRLLARLETETPTVGGVKVGWGWATAAAAAVLLPMLLWIPGTTGSLAFAEVQRHFTEFQTLTAQMTTTVGGNEIVEMTIRVDDRNRARLDVGDGFSYVIDPNRSTMLQLFHPQARALLVPLNAPDALEARTGLDWLAEIRQFKGRAEPLDQTVVIRGREAYGFRLDADGMNMTLWAAESGEPLRLQLRPEIRAGGIETRMDFEFDRPLAQGLFSLSPPAGYQLLDREQSDEALD